MGWVGFEAVAKALVGFLLVLLSFHLYLPSKECRKGEGFPCRMTILRNAHFHCHYF